MNTGNTPGETPTRRQLQMLWPESRLSSPPDVKLPSGYELRSLRDGEEDAYVALLHGAGFMNWTRAMLAEWQQRVLPGGLFVIEHTPSHRLVATAMATHNPTAQHPDGGELGWVAVDPRPLGQPPRRSRLRRCCRPLPPLGLSPDLPEDRRFPPGRHPDLPPVGIGPIEDDDSMPERWRVIRETLETRNPRRMT